MSISQADIDALLGTQGGAGPAEPIAHPEPVPERSKTGPEPSPSAQRYVPPAIAARAKPDIQRILRLSVPVSVTIAQRELNIEAILDIKVGTIIEFDIPFDADLTLKVTSHPIGTGQAVKVGERFGLRVATIGEARDRIEAMGGGTGLL